MKTMPPPSLKRRAVHNLERALYWSGLSRAFTSLRSVRGATVLMYHSVAEAPFARFVDPAWHMTPEAFEAQIRWLCNARKIISLDTLVDAMERGESLDAGSVVLTFDDGYLDNFEVAAPILAKYDAPATLYLATGYVSEGESQWVDRLYTAFRSRRRTRLKLDEDATFDLGRPEERLRAYRAASQRLIPSSRAERRALLAEIRAQLDSEELAPRLTMTWDEVRALTKAHPRFQLGVHTVDHMDLSACTTEEAEAQMRDSVAQTLDETGVRPTHFSFPYSRKTRASHALSEKLGFRSATGAGEAFLINAETDRFDLHRLDPNVDAALLRLRTSGAYPTLPMRLIGSA